MGGVVECGLRVQPHKTKPTKTQHTLSILLFFTECSYHYFRITYGRLRLFWFLRLSRLCNNYSENVINVSEKLMGKHSSEFVDFSVDSVHHEEFK